MFCSDCIKMFKSLKMSNYVLTFGMSKITKKYTKLLQYIRIVWYNAYTINNRKG